MDTNDLIHAVETAVRARYESHLLRDLFRGTMTPMPAPVRGHSPSTLEIKRFFHDLAALHGFEVSASGIPGIGGEWLYDLVWHAQGDGYYLRQMLVLESETKPWGTLADCGTVDGDFQKLVQARADIRVWVAALPNEVLLASHLENCKRQVDSFSQGEEGDYYLFVLFCWTSGTTTVDAYRRPPAGPTSDWSLPAPSVLS
jgi:hypothetical protein